MNIPEDSIVVTLPADVSIRIAAAVKAVTQDIEKHALIDLEAYNDGGKFWGIVRHNMLKSLVETYGDRLSSSDELKLTKNSRYIKISFNKT